MAVLERIEVPKVALQPKPWFPEFPDDEIVKEIRAFVADTGKPYLWRGHTHSKPVAGTRLHYVEEFSLPRTCRARQSWSPCPCCLAEFPKYKHGKIAWFPDEQVIRLIGPDCYAKLDAEGHAAATEELSLRRQEKRDIEYLLRLGPVIGEMRASLETAHSIAVAADDFFVRLRDRIETVLRVRLWSAIRSGDLYVSEVLIERYRDRDGEEKERQTLTTRRYASIKGAQALSPERSGKAERVARLLDRLGDQRLQDLNNAAMLDSGDRRGLAQKVARIVSDSERVLEELRLELQLLRAANFNTLRAWARHPNAPVRLFIEREPTAINVGRREGEKVRVPFDDVLNGRFPSLPKIAKTRLRN